VSDEIALDPASAGPARYPAALRALHWSIALLFAVQFALIGILRRLESLEFGKVILDIHRQCGTLILLLILVRLALVGRARPPRLDAPRWQARAARGVHLAMYAALAAQPILGLLISWARGDEIALLGLVRLPSLIVLTNEQGVLLEAWHRWLAYGLLALLAVHLGAIGFNCTVRRTWVVERMLSGGTPDRLVNKVPLPVQLAGCFGLILTLVVAASVYSAHQYSAFNTQRSHFDEDEVSLLDEMRVAQIDLIRKPHDRAVAKDVATTLHGFVARASDPGVRGAMVMAARALDRATGKRSDVPARAAADRALQDAIDSQNMIVFQGRLDIATTAAKGHDLIVVTVAPTILLCAFLAFLLSRSILQALAHARLAVRNVEQDRPDETLSISGKGEFAYLMRDIVSMRDAVKARLRDSHARELELAHEREAGVAEARIRAAAREAELAVEASRRESALAQVHASEQGHIVEEIACGLAALVAGELDYRMTRPCPNGFDRIRLDFNEAIARIEAAMTTIGYSSDAIATSAQDVTRTAGELAARSRDQANQVGETARAIDEMTHKVKAAAQSARDVAGAVGSARAKAGDSSAIMDEAIAAMNEVEAGSVRIVEIVDTIEQIAARSDLLALNASIEAHRAGDGGFAVIAQEVRALAQQAGEATDRIRAVIQGASTQVRNGVASVRRTGEALRQIVDDVAGVDQLVGGIASSANAQSVELEMINRTMEQMDCSVRENATAADYTNAELRNIRDSAASLDELIKRLSGDRAERPFHKAA
jgi:methyl-accepting chemotaxis protein/cytochrome b561